MRIDPKYGMWVCLIGLPFSGLLISCNDDDNGWTDSRHKASEEFAYTVNIDNRHNLRVETINGSVDITGLPNTDTVEVTGERIVRSEKSKSDASEQLQRLSVRIEEDEQGVSVETVQPDGPHKERSFEVHYQISVPDEWRVEAEQANGDIEIRSVRSDVTARTINGHVSVESCVGPLNLDAANGGIRFLDISGDIDARVSNGGIEGRLGEVTTGRYRLKTTNGGIALSVPTTISAVFSAEVVNGSIDISDVPLVSDEVTPKRVNGKIGDGEGLIELQTVNGSIVVSVSSP